MLKNLHFNYGSLWIITLFIASILIAGCQPVPQGSVDVISPPVDLSQVLKSVEAASGGWKPQEAPKFYTKDNLYDLMDGQSDAFFVYGFEQVGVQRFTGSSGAPLIVSVFQVDRPASAYGLFTVNRDGQPLALGNEGSTSPGHRLSFWQDRYFVQMTALKPAPEDDLKAVGAGIAALLPKGGKKPAIMSRLPQDGLAANPPPLFFHQELSIQDRVWLGGENKLGLGMETDGVLARYTLGGKKVELVIFVYPEAQKAEEGLQALQTSDISDLLAAKVNGNSLAAVFGEADKPAAEKLAGEALK